MSAKPFRRERVARTWGERARIFGPAALLSLAALIVTYHFVQPAPPRHIIFATGQEGGAYYLFGLRYQALLAREGIDVSVRPTSGSVENIHLLKKGEADVAFVQGGTGASVDAPGLHSLASLYYEPIWIFVRKHSGGLKRPHPDGFGMGTWRGDGDQRPGRNCRKRNEKRGSSQSRVFIEAPRWSLIRRLAHF